MPQLSTAHIFLIFIWTWFTLCLLIQKTKTVMINKTPTKTLQQNTKKLLPLLPWT